MLVFGSSVRYHFAVLSTKLPAADTLPLAAYCRANNLLEYYSVSKETKYLESLSAIYYYSTAGVLFSQ
jgi:hypothetical protein